MPRQSSDDRTLQNIKKKLDNIDQKDDFIDSEVRKRFDRKKDTILAY